MVRGLTIADLAQLGDAAERLDAEHLGATLVTADIGLSSGARVRVALIDGELRLVEVLPPDDTDAPARPPAADAPAREPGAVLSSPLTSDDWKQRAAAVGLAHSLLLRTAREIASGSGLEPPKSLDDIDEVLTPLLTDWLADTYPAAKP